MTTTPRPLVIRREISAVALSPDDETHRRVANEVKDHLQGLLRLLSGFDELEVKAVFGDKTTTFDVVCRQEDFGRILGKSGKNIESFRQICSAVTAKCGFRSIINLPYFPPNK